MSNHATLNRVSLTLILGLVLFGGCSFDNVKKQGLRLGELRAAKSNKSTADAEKVFDSARACGTDYDPGHTNLHLLSTDEYNNTIRDLLYVSAKASDLAIFEATPKGGTGLTTDTSNVPLTPLTISKYWDAATALADEVLRTKGETNGAYAKLAPCAVTVTPVTTACIADLVSTLGLRAWRRPLTGDTQSGEIGQLMGLVDSAATFDNGFKALIQALLISPNFLFVSVTSDKSAVDNAVFPLDPYQLASRLSYYLWATMPDQELFDLAGSGQITNRDILEGQVTRMLKNPRASYLISQLTNDWIGIDQLATMVTPSLSTAIKNAMMRETELLVQDIIKDDKSLITLVSSQYSYLNQPLAEHYGVPFTGSDPEAFSATDLSATPRRGVLSHGSFLLATAGSTTETRPVKRGRILATDWLCNDIPPPPPGVPPLDPAGLPPDATPRQMLAVHTESPACAGCHRLMDPLGLAFESFDSFGRWRTTYAALNQAPIDSSGELTDGTVFRNTEGLLSHLTTSKTVKTCLSRRMLETTLKRRARASADQCASTNLGEAALSEQGKFSDLIKLIVFSRQFGLQTGEAP